MQSRTFSFVLGFVLVPFTASVGCSSAETGGFGTGGLTSGVGGTVNGTGATSSGGASGSGGSTSSGGVGTGGVPTGGSATGGTNATEACARADLVWKTGKKTNYESYPDPGSDECVIYNGCEWAGQFWACNGVQSEAWVASHNIAALFPGIDDYALHDLCIRSGDRTMIVTVYDTCGDDDCDGCCTTNKGSADALVDLEKSTNERWGLPDGDIEWADLGPTTGDGCEN